MKNGQREQKPEKSIFRMSVLERFRSQVRLDEYVHAPESIGGFLLVALVLFFVGLLIVLFTDISL